MSAKGTARAARVKKQLDMLARERAIKAELLEALKNVLILAVLKWGNLDPDANAAFDDARAAIAKAEGRS